MAPAPRSRRSRLLIAIAVLSVAGITLAYLVTPAARWDRAWVSNLSMIWIGLLAAIACAAAGNAMAEPGERRAWYWLTGGCVSFIGAQLVWSHYELVREVAPPYPSVADIASLGLYACMGVAVVLLWRPHPRRRVDVELTLDALLVTFTLATLAHEFFVEPIVGEGQHFIRTVTSVAWSIGGVLVLWLILMEMLFRARLPRAGIGFVLLALVVLSGTNVGYAMAMLHDSFASGGLIDLGRVVGFGLIAIGAAVVADIPSPSATPAAAPRLAPRIAAMSMGLAGMMALAATGALRAQREVDIAILALIGLMIIAARVLFSLRADRRYAEVLEREVASQTRTLMDSLTATAAAERNLRLVMEAVPDAIVLLDRDGHAVDLNGAASTLFGEAEGGSVGHSIFEILDPDTVRFTREHLDAAFEGEVRRFEVSFVRGDRTRGISSVQVAPVREGGRVTRVLALARDVTDLRRAEVQLQQAEKLAAMGQLVSGVAHEINNPAAIISGFAQTMMLDDMKPDQHDMIKMIYDEATRIGRITQNLLAFARAGGKDRTLVDVNDVVRRTVALRAYHLSTLNITMALELDPQEPKLWGNASELQQMLLNLVINAEQALMTVETSRSLGVRTLAREPNVTIACFDSGPGIPPEIRERIFDPFFTTKPEGIGTGLGLSICYGIVHDHGGRLTVESSPGGGTTFTALLPRDPRTQRRVSAEVPTPQERGTGVSDPVGPPLAVLLVDDEVGLRKAVARFLNRRGMQCRAVGDGSEALDVLRSQDFDIIISDVRMPGMSGREFLVRLQAERPELVPKLIFSTGDSFAADTAALLNESGVPALVKPFDFARLEAVVREVAIKAST